MIILPCQPNNRLMDVINLMNTVYGGGTINLNPTDIFYVNENIILPSNITINGNGATIDFGGGAYQILIEGSNPYSTGTLSVNFGSTSVTGSGTAWTSDMVGQSILIGDYWYIISAVGSATGLTLSSPMVGTSLSGDTYVIATTVNNTGLENLVVQNSSVSLIYGRYVNTCNLTNVITNNGNVGLDFANSQGIVCNGCIQNGCTSSIIFNNVPLCTIESGGAYSGGGISLTRVTNTSMGIITIQDITGVGLSIKNCSNFGVESFAIIECTSHGIEFVSGNSDIAVLNGEVNSVGGDGIKLTASSNRIEISIANILNNTGHGINIANSNCNNAILVGNNTYNNTAGALSDSGTGTLKSSTVNNFN